jgi:rhomboid family GlyGly-CTERM serine protease
MSATRWLNRQGLLVYVMLLACLAFGPWSDMTENLFTLDRAGMHQGEYWRLWTGHFVHLSWSHLLLNGLGLMLLQQIFGGQLAPFRWVAAVIVIAPLMGVWWQTQIFSAWLPVERFDYVVGMSGLLHGLFVYAAILSWSHDKVLASIVLLVIAGKVLSELLLGASAITSGIVGLPVAVEMHLYGVLGGTAFGVAMSLFERAIAK